MSTSTGLRLNADSTIVCNTYPDRTPILGIWDGTNSIDIYTSEDRVTEHDIEFARQLVSVAKQFLTEVERLATVKAAAR